MSPGFSRLRALLGPTNTGKTYFAIDRMLAHGTGMIGFPLRLLARENYDRIVAARGKGSVALITGEEKIVPANPRWFVCTVESMPLDREVDFLAIDEIQLAADADRGHVFTDRLLHARGLEETMFLGSDVMRNVIRRLVDGVDIDKRERFSTLAYAGPKNLTRLPRRSAVVAFSVDEVYALAERVRRQRGGTAVVLGALSPRTRNAQVAMYQAGEVDHMVATDAIGMGLNMDINHVAFAGLRKFDGRRLRPLSPVEVGQIAGRAGRHMSDGTFGTTGGIGELEGELVEAVEAHRFDPVKTVFWRSRDLDFASPRALLSSLGRRPQRRELVRAREADDQLALAALVRDGEIADLATNPAAVRLLWEVCQIPDFRKVMPDIHARLLGQVYTHLMTGDGRLPEDWVRAQVDRLDDAGGDIDTLTNRIAHIRTWTYIGHRGDWLDDSMHWQARAGEIEDKLSDALHARLTQRFVDRRAATIGRERGENATLLSAVTAPGEVVVEGHRVGHLHGLAFVLDSDGGRPAPPIVAAARRALMQDVGPRVGRLVAEGDGAFSLGDDGRLAWRGAPVARLIRGETLLAPRIEVLRNELLDTALREKIRARLAKWMDRHIEKRFRPLFKLAKAKLKGPARGLVFRLSETLGSLPGPPPAALLRDLDGRDRKTLQRYGLRINSTAVYFTQLLKPAAVRLRRVLWAAHTGRAAPDIEGGDPISLAAGKGSRACWAHLGYRCFGRRALRLDRVSKLARTAWARSRQGPFLATPELVQIAGCDGAALEEILAGLGFRAVREESGTVFRAKPKRGKRGGAGKGGRHKRRQEAPVDPDSPFAGLKNLVSTK